MAERVPRQAELNRALLVRQPLLRRVRMPVREAVEHLLALQAQAPRAAVPGLSSATWIERGEDALGQSVGLTGADIKLKRWTFDHCCRHFEGEAEASAYSLRAAR